eukprot:13732918-Alexandrium_andersonii.AAC.1
MGPRGPSAPSRDKLQAGGLQRIGESKPTATSMHIHARLLFVNQHARVNVRTHERTCCSRGSEQVHARQTLWPNLASRP